MYEEKKIYERKRLKKEVRISLIVIIVVFLLSGSNLIYKSLDFQKKNSDTILYSYSNQNKVNYNVYLYENSFIEKEYLGEDETYISDLVDYIPVSFNYNFSGSKTTNLKYNYSIKAVIHGEYQLDEEDDVSKLWTKEYVLLNSGEKEILNSNQININEQTKIDYHFYDNEVTEFRSKLNLSISAYLEVIMEVNVVGSGDSAELNYTRSLSTTIPLSQQAFKISKIYADQYNGNVLKEEVYVDQVNSRKLICGITLLLMDLVIFISLFKKIFNIKVKNYYNQQLSKILKEYGDVIVEVNNVVDNKNMTIMEVKNFNEMIDLEEEFRIPILFYEIEEDQKGIFMLVQNNLLYCFKLENK